MARLTIALVMLGITLTLMAQYSEAWAVKGVSCDHRRYRFRCRWGGKVKIISVRYGVYAGTCGATTKYGRDKKCETDITAKIAKSVNGYDLATRWLNERFAGKRPPCKGPRAWSYTYDCV